MPFLRMTGTALCSVTALASAAAASGAFATVAKPVA